MEIKKETGLIRIITKEEGKKENITIINAQRVKDNGKWHYSLGNKYIGSSSKSPKEIGERFLEYFNKEKIPSDIGVY